MMVGLVLGCALVLLVAYRTYGRLLGRLLRLDDANPTPAVAMRDDVDYAPLETSPLLSQHFSAIAAAGPIVGPILAGALFGWVPAMLWILCGAIWIGGVHDFSALVASVRHSGRSIAEVVRQHVSGRSFVLFLTFVWLALIYIIGALGVIALNLPQLPGAFMTILDGAFTAQGVQGGVIGALIQGFRRAAFSNEAGLGSAPIAHAAVRTREPMTEGFVALWEPFIDTVVICTMTALVIIITNFRDEDSSELAHALRLLRTRHLVMLASLRERIVGELIAQPLGGIDSAVDIGSAHLYEQSRRDAFNRLAARDSLMVDAEPQRLGIELVNRYNAVKRAGML